MTHITTILYWISTGLLIPVILLLLILLVKSLLLIGSFFSLYRNKTTTQQSLDTLMHSIDAANAKELIHQLPKQSRMAVTLYLQKMVDSNHPLRISKLLNDFEIHCQKELSGSQTLAKMGPILGLMGTLIPMGPALVGLASGDIASMASNMQVAFATTVIGLLIGAIGFIILQIKRRWMAHDINNLEFVAEILKTPKQG